MKNCERNSSYERGYDCSTEADKSRVKLGYRQPRGGKGEAKPNYTECAECRALPAS